MNPRLALVDTAMSGVRMLDLFSGIGGFHKGFAQAGYKFDWVGFSEIDKYASAVYKHRFKEAEELGDITTIQPVLTPNRLEKQQNGRRFKEDGEDMFTLTQQDQHGVMFNNSIRRLTPKECERLQGFPDNWTRKGVMDGKVVDMSDTQRYKQCGNAVTVDVVQAVAKRICPLINKIMSN